MPAKSLFIAIKGSKSTLTRRATIEVDVQRQKEIRTFLVSNLIDWDVIIAYLILHHLKSVIHIKDNRVFIQPKGKMRYDHNMLDRVTVTLIMVAEATFTEEYDLPYDSPLSYDSSSNAHTTEAEYTSAINSEGEPALPHT